MGRVRSWIVPAFVLALAVAWTWGDWATLALAVGILIVLEVLHRAYLRRSFAREHDAS